MYSRWSLGSSFLVVPGPGIDTDDMVRLKAEKKNV